MILNRRLPTGDHYRCIDFPPIGELFFTFRRESMFQVKFFSQTFGVSSREQSLGLKHRLDNLHNVPHRVYLIESTYRMLIECTQTNFEIDQSRNFSSGTTWPPEFAFVEFNLDAFSLRAFIAFIGCIGSCRWKLSLNLFIDFALASSSTDAVIHGKDRGRLQASFGHIVKR